MCLWALAKQLKYAFNILITINVHHGPIYMVQKHPMEKLTNGKNKKKYKVGFVISKN